MGIRDSLWASWCGYCIKEIPYFNEVHERLAGEGVRIVAVNVLDSAGDPYTPVSYTHLDVYKRQPRYRLIL